MIFQKQFKLWQSIRFFMIAIKAVDCVRFVRWILNSIVMCFIRTDEAKRSENVLSKFVAVATDGRTHFTPTMDDGLVMRHVKYRQVSCQTKKIALDSEHLAGCCHRFSATDFWIAIFAVATSTFTNYRNLSLKRYFYRCLKLAPARHPDSIANASELVFFPK